MKYLHTTLGAMRADELGAMLPHEHIFANFYTGDDCGARVADVIERVKPALVCAQAFGVTALVDATSIGGARRVDILRAVSQATGLPVVVATGIFKEPVKTDCLKARGEDGIFGWMLRELMRGVDGTDVRAGWIKLNASDDALSESDTVLLRIAAETGRLTQAAIGVHTVRGRVALDQLDMIEQQGYLPHRFIWIHTQVEPDTSLHLEAAKRGAWIEYDNIGVDRSDEDYVALVMRVLEAGYGNRLLLSHDRTGYDPRLPVGGEIAPYSTLFETFLPKLRAAGVDDATIRQLIVVNPFEVFAR